MTLDVANMDEIRDNLAAGEMAILEIAENGDFAHSASLSKMRDGLCLLRSGVVFPMAEALLEDEMLALLDEMIETAGGVDERLRDRARQLAAQYVAAFTTEAGREMLRKQFIKEK